jgi:hypothetical protein
MKFMEIDEGGYVHHICDDPEITIIPLMNRVSHGSKDKPLLDHVDKPISMHGYRWLPPMPIGQQDFDSLTKEGLCGMTEKGTKWHYKYDQSTKTFSKVTVL